MNTIVITASVFLALIALTYAFILKHLNAPVIKRYFLLSIVPLSFALTLVQLEGVTISNPIYTLSAYTVGTIADNTSTGESISFVLICYIIGVLSMLCKYAYGYFQLRKLTKNALKTQCKGKIIWVSSNLTDVFTFGTKIFSGKGVLPSEILTHECEHLRQFHYLDKLFLIALKIIFWFHPAVYFIANWSEVNNEILADGPVAKSPEKKEDYIHLLKQEALQKIFPEWAMPFSKSSQLKNRIKMMHKKEQNKQAKLSTLFVAIGLLTLAPIINSSCSKETSTSEEVEKKELQSPEKPLSMTEIMPEFIGGTPALFAYLGENINYPKSAEATNVEGIVYVTFVIDKTGKVRDAKVLKGFDTACNEEALRVIKAMPNWTPGQNEGKPVDVQYNIPIRFQLKD